jgi:hypothetical protein
MKDHPLLKRLRLSSMPPVLGCNRVRPREGCPVIARGGLGIGRSLRDAEPRDTPPTPGHLL